MPTNLTNQQIINLFPQLVRSERKLTAQIVECIKEIDSRRLFLELGYTSTFAYLTEGMGYTASAAQRRIDSARLLRELPTLRNEIRNRNLNLTQLSIVAHAVRTKEKSAGVRIAPETKLEICADLKNQSTQATQQKVAELLNLPVEYSEKKKMQQDQSIRLEVTLTADQMAKLSRARDLLSSSCQGISTAELITKLADDFLNRKDPVAIEQRAQIRRAANAASKAGGHVDMNAAISNEDQLETATTVAEVKRPKNSKARRGLSPRIRRFVLCRDQACQWKDSVSGKICGSTFDLEIDHIHPLWAGGGDDPANLQTLCRVHNQMKYRKEAGIHFV